MGSQVLEWSVRAAMIAAGTAMVLGIMRVRAAAARHAAWTVVLAAMLALPAWNTWGPKIAAPVLPAAVGQIPSESAAIPEMPVPQGFAAEAGQLPEPGRAGMPVPRSEHVARTWTWSLGWASAGLYLVGLGIMLLRLAAGTMRARALARRASAADGLRSSAECAAPLTVGWLRPVVVLPEGWKLWPAAELDAVLTHEREHARRRDPLVQWLALLNRCIFWFHPLAWWLERKLSALAEDACDAAVLRRGHDPHAYAEYLIELARSVQQAGARLPVWGAAMDGGTLPARIHRMLDGRPAPALSRKRAALAAGLCGLTIVAFAGCKLERAKQAAPGQPTMNELMHRSAEQRKADEERRNAVVEAAKALTPSQSQDLEAKLRANPQDDDARKKLLTYYQYKGDFKARDRHILWLIEHEPECAYFGWPYFDPNPDGEIYEQGKKLWLAHVNEAGATVAVNIRAAGYLARSDKPQAEQILLKGRSAYPDDERLRGELAFLYTFALTGPEARTAFGQSVQKKLTDSTDTRLLASVAQRLLFTDKPELAKQYAVRAESLQPDNPAAHEVMGYVRRREVQSRDLAELTGSDRVVRLTTLMEWDYIRERATDADAKAREILKLAPQYPNDPLCGDAIFEANMTLGKLALRSGDKSASARYLLTAAQTEGSDKLKYSQIPMELPRSLVDWGERDAVAEFLERCSQVNVHAKQLAGWAAEIRRGINPDLIPLMTGCGKEPC